MCCGEKKVHYIRKSEPANYDEENDSYIPVGIDRMKERQATTSNDTQWTTNLKLQCLTVPLKLDMGSDVNILPMSYYKK